VKKLFFPILPLYYLIFLIITYIYGNISNDMKRAMAISLTYRAMIMHGEFHLTRKN
jgi:hypothetical protein